jgi:hypothetical protein
MARDNFTPAALEALFAQQTSEVFLPLLEIDEATLPEPIRVVNNTQSVYRGGELYVAMRFALSLPNEEDGTIRSVQLIMDNVSRDIARAIDLAVGQPTATLIYVLASDLEQDPPEAGPFVFVFESARYDAKTASAALRFTDVIHRRYPQHGYTPAWTPELF